jgi:hypothetical protein
LDDEEKQRGRMARLRLANEARDARERSRQAEQAARRHYAEMDRLQRESERRSTAAMRSLERQSMNANAAANRAIRQGGGGRAPSWDSMPGAGGGGGGRAGGGGRGIGGMGGRGAIGGFVGLPGGMGGFYMPGAAGAALSVGQSLVRSSAGAYMEQNEKFRESDMALRRMYSYVGQDERGRGNDFSRMSGTARRMSVSRGMSIPESAGAMQEALTNAIPAEQAERFATMADALAKMEGVDLKTTVSGLAAIRNAYGLSMEDMEKVPNMLAAAMQEGNVKIQGLSNVIGQTAQLSAEAFGGGLEGLEQLLGTMSAFTLKGVPAEVASTSMRSMASNVINPSESAKKVQKEIGFAMTPDKVKAMGGITQAFGAMQEAAAKRGGIRGGMSSMFEAFTGEVRTAKIMPTILNKGGADVQAAIAAQRGAVGENRMARIDRELMESPQMRFQKAEARKDLALQNMAEGGAAVLWEEMKAEAAEAMGRLFMGAKSISESTGGGAPVTADQAAMLSADADQLSAAKIADIRRGIDPEQDRHNVKVIAQRMAKFDEELKAEQEKFQARLRDEKGQEILAVEKSVDANKDLAEEVQKIVNKAMPTFQKGLTIASSAMDKWGHKLAELSALHGAIQNSQTERERALSGAGPGNAGSILQTLERESEFGNMAANAKTSAEKIGFLGQQQEAGGAFAGMDLASIARSGSVNEGDLNAYIESQIRSKRLKGYDAIQFRRSMQQRARGFAKEVVGGRASFDRAGGGTDEEFAADFALQRGKGVRAEMGAVLKGGEAEATEKYAEAKANYEFYANRMKDVEMSWSTILEKMQMSESSLEGLSSQSFLTEIRAAAEAAKSLNDSLLDIKGRATPQSIDSLRREQDSNFPIEDVPGSDKMEIDRKLGLDSESGFIVPGARNQVAGNGNTVYNQQKINVTVNVPEGVTDPEGVAQAVADKLRTDQERGRVTLTPAA